MIRIALFTANDTIAGEETKKDTGKKPVTRNQQKAEEVCQHMMWLPHILEALKLKSQNTTSN